MIAFFFDLDGTIIDSRVGIIHCLQWAMQKSGLPEKNASEIIIGAPVSQIIQDLYPSTPPEKLTEVEGYFRKCYDQMGWRLSTLYTGVVETLSALKKHSVFMGMITNKPELPTRKIIQFHSLKPFFSELICTNSSSRVRTKAEIIASCLDKYKIVPSHFYYVGDSWQDFQASQANQVQFIYARYGYGEIKGFTSSDYDEINSFSELIQVALQVPI